LAREAQIAQYKKDECIASGEKLDLILAGPFDCLSLEHYFREVDDRVASDEHLLYNLAGTLELLFTPEQIRVLGYLFWETFSEEESHKRQQKATFRFDLEHLRSGG
jgi:hypothetical protein